MYSSILEISSSIPEMYSSILEISSSIPEISLVILEIYLNSVNVNLNMSKKFKIKMYILFICLLEKIFKSIRISSYFSYM